MKNRAMAQEYATAIAEKLHTLKVGEEVTIARLFTQFFPGVPQDEQFLTNLSVLLPKAAKIEGFLLEPAEDNAPEGLPYNLPMVLKKKEQQQHLKVKCPHCGKSNAIMYIHGMPTHEGFEMAQRGDAILCGCCIDGSEPQYRCAVCHKDFGNTFII